MWFRVNSWQWIVCDDQIEQSVYLWQKLQRYFPNDFLLSKGLIFSKLLDPVLIG